MPRINKLDRRETLLKSAPVSLQGKFGAYEPELVVACTSSAGQTSGVPATEQFGRLTVLLRLPITLTPRVSAG